MKLPVESYEKLYNSFLLDEYPIIERIQVKPASVWKKIGDLGIGAQIIIKVYLKKNSNIKYSICTSFGRELSHRINELNGYLGPNISRDIKIYHDGKIICTDDDFYSR